MGSLAVRLIKNSVVYPTIRVASHPGKLLMGVYDEDSEYVEGTALDRRSGERGAPVPPGLFPTVSDSDPPEAIYAGPLYYHFGHFLLESLARAWYTHQQPDIPFVWAGAHAWQGYELHPWQSEILDILEIANPTRIIADPARFEVLHIPDIGYRYDDRFHPEHAEFLGRYPGPSQVRHRRLWLSRSKTGGNVRDLNSEPTERRLAHAGWVISNPETLTVREQLDHLARAEIVAGEEGSAFHALMLLKDVSAKKVHIIRRYGPEHPNMRTIGDARQIDQTFHSLTRERVLRAEGRVVSKLTPSSSEVLDLLAVPAPAALDLATAPPDTAILQRVLADLEPQSFLSVGARDPQLIVASTAPTRVAVGEFFEFDPRSYSSSGVDFYELELEQYADLFHEEGGTFDVIRIAGADYDEVMAAFRLSRRLAHDDTTWILGSGDLAARAALAITMTHPGFTARRLIVQRTWVYLARRTAGEPTDDAGVGALSADEISRRGRWLPLTSLRRIRRRRSEARRRAP